MPRLVLEYIPFGSLEDQHKEARISVEESFAILRQGLGVLRYLHEREDPIAHRDIKPSNILVQSRTPYLHIKLADFGFSKESQDYLRTYCGTRFYTAPEVHKKVSYDTAVDIWSLGLVVFQYAHGLPGCRISEFDGVKWTREIIQALEAAVITLYCPLLVFLSKAMLVEDPESRYSAHRCWKQTWQLDISQFRCSTPTPASYTEEEEQTTIRFHAGNDDDDGDVQRTVLFQGAGMATDPNWRSSSIYGGLTDLISGGRNDRSGAPPPESFVSTPAGRRKRTSQVSKPSPSNRSRTKRRGSSDNAAEDAESSHVTEDRPTSFILLDGQEESPFRRRRKTRYV